MYHPDDFRQHFRVSRKTADILATALGHCSNIAKSTDRVRRGRVPMNVHKQLLVTLWMLATQETIRGMADRFGICGASVYRTVRRVTVAIFRNWTSKVIVWSSSPETVRCITEGFHRRRGLQNVLGAIDGSHIPIKAPRVDQDSYINRKNFHSVVLQAVCNHRMYFTDCFTGYPGSTHDARVLQNSEIFERFCRSKSTIFPGESYLLGDSAYPLTPWLLTPYRDNGHLTAKQRNYNFLHSSSRMVIERAFALLKGRFPRLKYVDIDRLEDLPTIILAACTMHNICLVCEEDIDDFLDDVADHADVANDAADGRGDTASGNCRRNLGKLKRNLIAEHLWEHSRVVTA